jgi:hypothetical protein
MQTTDTFFSNRGLDPARATDAHHAAAALLIALDDDYHLRTTEAAARLVKDPSWGLSGA